MKNVAVILAGCGYLDGAEIRESVLTLLALDSSDVAYKIFALNEDQHHVINHLTGEQKDGEKRNILEEAARIARGKIENVSNLDVTEFDALILPGGFGVAKNMCSFAFDGSRASVNETIVSIVRRFHAESKPIGAICISPSLVSLSIGDHSPTITLGEDENIAKEIEKTGAVHESCVTSEFVVDPVNKVVTTPAYMKDDAKLSDVYVGVSNLVNSVLELA